MKNHISRLQQQQQKTHTSQLNRSFPMKLRHFLSVCFDRFIKLDLLKWYQVLNASSLRVNWFILEKTKANSAHNFHCGFFVEVRHRIGYTIQKEPVSCVFCRVFWASSFYARFPLTISFRSDATRPIRNTHLGRSIVKCTEIICHFKSHQVLSRFMMKNNRTQLIANGYSWCIIHFRFWWFYVASRF